MPNTRFLKSYFTSPAADHRAKVKPFIDRVIRVSPAFAQILHTDSLLDLSINAKAFDPAHLKEAWSWSDGNAETRLILAEAIQGSFRARYGNVILVHRQSHSDTGSIIDGIDGEISEGTGANDADDFALGISARQEINLSVFPVAGGAFLFGSNINGKAGLISERTGKRIGHLINLQGASLVEDLRLTENRKFVVQLNEDGRFWVSRLDDGALMLKGAIVDDEVVIMTPDGRYDGSAEAAQSLQMRFSGVAELLTIHQFRSALYRPGLAKAILSGAPVAPIPETLVAPPTAALNIGSTPFDGKWQVRVTARSDSGLATISLRVDGRLFEERAVSGSSADITIGLPNPGGGRWVTATVRDKDGLVSAPYSRHLMYSLRPHGMMRAVIVGIDAYTADPDDIPSLTSSVKDAHTFAQALKSGLRRTTLALQTKVLTNADATASEILTLLSYMASETKRDDTLILYFAGHGLDGRKDFGPSGDLLLALSNTRLDDLANTTLSWRTITKVLGKARGTILIILDACHSGIAGKNAFSNDNAVNALLNSAGAPMVVLAGSKGEEASLEDQNGGLFTQAIAAAISTDRASADLDGNGIIDLGELYYAVKRRVTQAAKAFGKTQTPWIWRNDMIGEMALF